VQPLAQNAHRVHSPIVPRAPLARQLPRTCRPAAPAVRIRLRGYAPAHGRPGTARKTTRAVAPESASVAGEERCPASSRALHPRGWGVGGAARRETVRLPTSSGRTGERGGGGAAVPAPLRRTPRRGPVWPPRATRRCGRYGDTGPHAAPQGAGASGRRRRLRTVYSGRRRPGGASDSQVRSR